MQANIDLKEKKILIAHSNQGKWLQQWHQNRVDVANEMGYNVNLFNMTDHYSYTIFPYLDKKWKKRERRLMEFYDKLGEAISSSDIFIHYNGALIHPGFLEQFNNFKVYHCADDPDASKVLSKPVASYYDACAISNPACIDMYNSWGCKNVFFWPLGGFHFDYKRDEMHIDDVLDRKIPLVYIGSKLGVSNIRYIGRFLGLYQKKMFFNKLEKRFPQLLAYGDGWKNGRISDEEIIEIYQKSLIGINIHNSLGPINGRLYDLAAFGICQICDNKKNLNSVFEEGKEIIGFETTKECFEKINYYLEHPEEAIMIGQAAQQRFMNDYTTEAIWNGFFRKLEPIFSNSVLFK